MRAGGEHPSKLALDLALINAESAEVRSHIASCDSCKSTLEGMRVADAAFLEANPRPRMGVVRDVEASNVRRLPVARISAALAVAASVAFAAILVLKDPNSGVRGKGGSNVELYVRRGESSFRFENQPLMARDTLLFHYTSTRTNLVVFSAEASGKVSVLIEEAISPGHDLTAHAGVELDDYAGSERIIALLCSEAIATGPLVEQLKARSELQVPCDQTSWKIEKAK